MHLKSLTLKGFKSFASATTLKFEPGICAVVGPNGSGKSNVVDALAWVMGEQGAKTLRGGKMQDVIFAGAGERKALGRAEVTLTIDNHDGVLPIDYQEVSVTRRMFRDGGSEYEINGSRARLMDVQELLSDSGIGREMHIIVGQGKLSEILESRPEDRRAFIEEAAGVLKHRRRKEKAQRKLAGMQANLDRLKDLTAELSRQLTPLARQAEAAKKAATVQAELREARHNLAAVQIIDLRVKLKSAEGEAQRAAEEEDILRLQLQELEQELGMYEEEVAVLSPRVAQAQEVHFQLSTLLERVSATLRIARDRAGDDGAEHSYSGPDPQLLEAQAKRAHSELSELKESIEIAEERLVTIEETVSEQEERLRMAEAEHLAQVRAIADRREGIVRLLAAEESQAKEVAARQAEIQRLSEDETFAKAQLQEIYEEQEEARRQLAQWEADAEPLNEAERRAQSELAQAKDRLTQIYEEQKGYERRIYGLQSRIETLRHTIPAVPIESVVEQGEWGLQPISELLGLEPGIDKAVAAALGAHSDALATSHWGEIEQKLQDVEVSRLTLMRWDDQPQHGGDGWHLEVELPGTISWLRDKMSPHPGIAEVITRLLADVVLVPDGVRAQEVVREDPRLRAVTLTGELYGEGWVQRGQAQSTRVEISSQISEAEMELTRVEHDAEQLKGTVAGAEHSAEDARMRSAKATAAIREITAKQEECRRNAQRIARDVERREEQWKRIQQQIREQEERRAQAERCLADTRDRVARAEEPDSSDQPSTEARDEAQAAVAQGRAMEMEARMSLRQLQDKAEQLSGRAERLVRQAEQEKQARQRFEARMQQRRRRVALARKVADLAAELEMTIRLEVDSAGAQRDDLLSRETQLKNQVNGLKQQVKQVRTHHARKVELSHDADMALSQAQVRHDETVDKTVEQLGIPVAELLENHQPGPDFDVSAERKRVKQAERDLRSLGKVNPLALEEYRALEERHRFLSSQLDDVLQARSDLEGVIYDVDARILQLFCDAWRDVEAEFPAVFRTLFPGGEGRLILTEPADMLTTGIEVEARPPGKKVTRLSLLSGGEKSLTALAMLVAIFKARPSPFYVLDEVEAALDDVNLRRLIALLEELRKDSQLIVITHQKPTMDVANVLYGVTMRDDGVTRVLSQRMSPHRVTKDTE
ncbi:chromosome segregation protein SMC [Corynebacterium sp. 3HC-13]|uniref:chromosome segregation protein SMC n=1 Tax=Corynebacterium poyangense TaxID=2684405 RepID=UPI001CCDC039|nr:chromosome segregation protein SMC [Corynebacterium poyangense]MBZ8178081.1 chromosome segregation protein SMC [Corynebacterium poyangense]